MVVQIGSHHSAQFEGVDLSLVDLTSIGEVAWILKHSLLHVDGESGLVRMARALHTTSIVLFGPTSPSFFSFERNINLVSGVCNDCWWSKQDWMSFCPRGLKEPECMTSIEPEQVLQAAADYLSDIKPTKLEISSAALYDETNIPARSALVLSDAFKGLDSSTVVADQERDAALEPASQWEYMFARDALEDIQKSNGGPLKIAVMRAGRSRFPAWLAKNGHSVTVIDRDFAADDPVTEHRFLKWSAENNVAIEFGTLMNVPAEDETYDAVLLMSALEDVSHKSLALLESARILKRGGAIIYSFELTLEPESAQKNSNNAATPLTIDRLASCLAEIGLDAFSAADVEKIRPQTKVGVSLERTHESTLAAIVIQKAGDVSHLN